MADDVNNLSGKVGLDTTDYKAGIIELNRQIRVIESGFKATAATMGEWDKSATGLETRNKTLSQTIDLQKQKVSALTAEYKKIVTEKGADSRAAEEMQIKINKETTALNQNEAELKQNTKALEDDRNGTKKLGDEQEQAEKKTTSFKDAMSGLGSVLAGVGKALAAVGAAAAAAVGGLVALVVKSAGAADSLAETADKTGLTVQQLQELDYIGKQIGVDGDTITMAMSRITRAMGSAKEGTGAQAEAFNTLKINIHNLDGSLKSNQQVFAETLAKLKEVPNATDRDILANDLFGKSFQELNPLIKADATELARMTQEAHNVGAVMSDKAVKGLGDFNDLLDSMKSGIKGVAGEIAAALLPGFSSVATGLQGYLAQLAGIVSGSNGNIGQMASGIGTLFGKMLTDLGKKLPEMLSAGIGLLQGIIDAIISSLPMLIPAALQIIQSLVSFLTKNLPVLITAAVQIISQLAIGLIGMLPQLLLAAIQIILALANGITAALPTLIPAVLGIIPQIVIILLDNLPAIIQAALQLIISLANGLIDALPELIKQVPAILQSFAASLIKELPLLIVAAVQIILALAFGIIQNLPLLLQTIPQLIKAMVDQFSSPEFQTQMQEMGTQLINGLTTGWTISWANFKTNLSTNFASLTETVKALLKTKAGEAITSFASGITSKLSVIVQSGVEMVTSFIQGITDEFQKILDIGASIIDGVWQGIQSKAAEFEANVRAFFTNIVKSVKESLGIHSPSTVFAEMGENMVAGLGVGFERQMKSVDQQLRQAVAALASSAGASIPVNVTANASVNGSGQQAAAANGKVYQLYFETYSAAGLQRTLRQVEMLYDA